MDLQMESLEKMDIPLPLKKKPQQKGKQKEENEIEISFVKCKTAKEIVYHWGYLSKNRSLKTEIDLIPFLNKKSGPVSEAIKSVEDAGAWGFYRGILGHSGGEIYFWSNKKSSILDIVFVFAHEIAHAIGIKSEKMANKFGSVCAFALFTAAKYSRSKIQIKK